jgi:hypothetical protein
MTNRTPDRLYIEKTDRALYDKLKSIEVFKDKETKDLFLVAMSYGYKNEITRSIDTKDGFVRTEYLKPKDLALINAVALTQGGIEMLDKPDEVFKLAEEYANAGIKLLVGEIDSVAFGSFEKQWEKQIVEKYREIKA